MKLRNKKTGDVVEPVGITCINGRTFVRFDDGNGIFKFEAHSLAELNEEWEDAPAEPLIKDEKIRKAVRAWAEMNEVSQARTIESCSGAYWYIRAFYIRERRYIDLDIWGEMPRELVSNKYYTIAELCGEEEE